MKKDNSTVNTKPKDECADKKVRCKSLVIDGGRYRTQLPKKYEKRKPWAKPDPRQIVSYIPGTINDIYIKEGDVVKKGEKMLLLEAMKMLNIIEVPQDGKIKKVYIKKNDRIPKGHLMIDFE